jgi:hypothetical protein
MSDRVNKNVDDGILDPLCALTGSIGEPCLLDEALQDPNTWSWNNALKYEIKQLENYILGTLLIDLPTSPLSHSQRFFGKRQILMMKSYLNVCESLLVVINIFMVSTIQKFSHQW